MKQNSKPIVNIPRRNFWYLRHKADDWFDHIGAIGPVMIASGISISGFYLWFSIGDYVFSTDITDLFLLRMAKVITPGLLIGGVVVWIVIFSIQKNSSVRRFLFRKRLASMKQYRKNIKKSDKEAKDYLESTQEYNASSVLILRSYELDGRLEVVPTMSQIVLNCGTYIEIKDFKVPLPQTDFFSSEDAFDNLSKIARPTYNYVLSVGDRKIWGYDNLQHIESTNQNWRDDVAKLIGKMTTIIIMPWTTEGVRWEMQLIVNNALSKTIFVMPPIYTAEEHKTMSLNPYRAPNIFWKQRSICDQKILQRAWDIGTSALRDRGLPVPNYDFRGAVLFYDKFDLYYSKIPTSQSGFSDLLSKRLTVYRN